MSADNMHGDENIKYLTPQEEVIIESRVSELTQERLTEYKRFQDILAGIDPTETDTHIHRALNNLDKACKGEKIAITAVLNSLCHVQRLVYVEALEAWNDELREIAENELTEES